MLALAYEGALRREELCGLRRADVDADRRLLRLPAAGSRSRLTPLSPAVAAHLAANLGERGAVERPDGHAAFFQSESSRNRAAPITVWTWSKVTRGLARRSG